MVRRHSCHPLYRAIGPCHRGRGQHSVNLGSGGINDMERRIRAHGNFAEYVPLTLLLIAMDEMRGLWSLGIHILCIGLLCGRLSHAWGVSSKKSHFAFRVGGMGLTLISLGLAAFAVPLTALLRPRTGVRKIVTNAGSRIEVDASEGAGVAATS
jgi:uncharacterized membrane protein YecN with MAPEG domain